MRVLEILSKFMLVWALLVLVRSIPAQTQIPPSIQWEKCYGGSGSDGANFIQQTVEGGYIVAGQSNSIDGDVVGNHGGNDYWILKLDASGTIQWQKSLGGSSNDEAYSIKPTRDGGYIVAGWCNSDDGEVTGHHGSSGFEDYWIVKLDANGGIQWEQSFGGTSHDDGQSLLQASDGGYIVAGSSYSNDGDVSGNHGAYDYWIVKLDSNGRILWQQSYGGSNWDFVLSIIQSADNGYAIFGVSASTDQDVTGNHGGHDYWIVKIDSNGGVQWKQCYGGSGEEGTYPSGGGQWSYDGSDAFQQTRDGGYIFAGWSMSVDDEITGNHGGYDYWIVKLDSNGAVQWEKSLGGSSWDLATAIAQSNDGGYLVAGQSNSTDGDVTGNRGGNDYWILKLSDAGVIEWEKSCGGLGDDLATSMQVTSDGGVVVAGWSNSKSGDVTGNHGDYDYWIVKLGPFLLQKGETLDVCVKADSFARVNVPDSINLTLDNPAYSSVDSIVFSLHYEPAVMLFQRATSNLCQSAWYNIADSIIRISISHWQSSAAGTICTAIFLPLTNAEDTSITACRIDSVLVYPLSDSVFGKGCSTLVTVLPFCGVHGILYNPNSTSRLENYPNPFSSGTLIHAVVSDSDYASAQLLVYNILGNQIANLSNRLGANGETYFATVGLNPGIYFCVLQTTIGRITKELFVVK